MRTLFILSLVTISAISCKEIIAEDITAKMPVIILPAVNDTVQINPVHFKWNEIQGATKYHLMVVSPSFSGINSYWLDTLVIGTDFFYSLDSNEYEMRLSAVNNGYISDTVGPIKFWVGVQSVSTSGNVVLTAPVDLLYTNLVSMSNQFQWSALTGATSYQFEIRQGTDFATGTILEIQNNISTNVYTSGLTFAEGEYHWGVKAYFSNGSSTNYTTRTLLIDDTPPNIAVLSTPIDVSIVSPGSVSFTWNNGTDSGVIQSSVFSFIEIATDLAFTSIVYSNTLQASADVSTLAAGNYYWRVTNTDDAGNTAGPSSTFQVTVL
tara:strand:- start:12110 stop:13075 length:966 start_codon:yes stop_codon:yes gene_type:complete